MKDVMHPESDVIARNQGMRSSMKCTMVENGKKHRQNSHLIIHFPTSEGVSEVSERASE